MSSSMVSSKRRLISPCNFFDDYGHHFPNTTCYLPNFSYIHIGLAISPNKPFLGERAWNPISKTYGPYEWQTYVEIAARANRFGSGLVHLHQQSNRLAEPAQGWSVGIWSINRAAWTITDIACVAYNLVSVGLYDTLGPEAVTY